MIDGAAGGAVIRGAAAEVLRFPTGSAMSLLAEDVGESTSLSAHRSTLRAGLKGAQPHHHEHTTHLLFVVAGSLDLMLDQQFARLDAGDLAFIPPGVSHAFRAAPDTDADVFDVVTPGRSFDMFREFAEGAGGREPRSTTDPVTVDTHADAVPEWWTEPPLLGARS
jgi:quercetin dioxygenase-like cupin family protein